MATNIYNPAPPTFDWLLPPVEEEWDITGGLPVDPAVGDRYVSDGTDVGLGWYDTYIYEWTGSYWEETMPREGMMVWFLLDLLFYVFFSGGWMEVGSGSFWSLDDNQLGITGDKTGSFDLTTTGSISAATLTDGTFSVTGGAITGMNSLNSSATNITGTELETLSDGSNSDSLHEHTLASGITDTSIITLDYAFDNGKIIDGASSAANSFVVGNGTLTTSFSSYDLGYGLGTTNNLNSNEDFVYNLGSAADTSPIMYIAGNNLGGTCNPIVNIISWGSGGIGAGTSYLRYAVGHAIDIAYSLTSVSKYQFWLSENLTQVMELSTVGTQCQFKFVSSSGRFNSTTGAFEFLANGDVDDYLTISTLSNVPTIGTTGACNLAVTTSGTDIVFNTNSNTTQTISVTGVITLTDVQGVSTLDVTVPLMKPIATSTYNSNPYFGFGLFGVESAASDLYAGFAFIEDATNWGAMAWDKGSNSLSFISTDIVRMVLANQSSDYVEFGLSSANNIYMKAEGGSNLWLQADAAINITASNDVDDYISITTVLQVPTISTVGTCNLDINSTGTYVKVKNVLNSEKGRVVSALRATSNITLNTTYDNVFADTDGGAFTITLPAGVNGTKYRIINCGSSGYDVTIAPTGAEKITGANASISLPDSDIIILVYQSTEGWW